MRDQNRTLSSPVMQSNPFPATLDPSSRVTVLPYRSFRRGERTLVVNKENAGWGALNQSALDIISRIDKDTTVTQIAVMLSQSTEEVTEFLRSLYRAGIISIGGKSIFTSSLWSRYRDPFPVLLMLKMTDACNFACVYCYSEMNTHKTRMSLETAKQSINLLLERSAQLVRILFIGGEPLLELSTIRAIVTHAKMKAGVFGKQVEFAIQTNGSLLDDSAMDFLQTENVAIGLSLDGHPSINDLTRVDHSGHGTGNRIVATVEKLKGRGMKFGLITTVTSHNVAELLDSLLYFQDLGVPAVKVRPFLPVGRGSSSDRLAPDPAIFVESMIAILRSIERKQIWQILFNDIIYYVNNILLFDRLYMCRRSPCGAGVHAFSVKTNGDVYPCDLLIDLPDCTMGNVYDEDFDKWQRSVIAQRLRARSVDNVADCKQCTWKYFCCSPCAVQSLALGKGVGEKEFIDCYLSRYLFEELLWSIAEGTALVEYHQKHYRKDFLREI